MGYLVRMSEPGYKVKLLEHKILVHQQLLGHVSLANMVEYWDG